MEFHQMFPKGSDFDLIAFSARTHRLVYQCYIKYHAEGGCEVLHYFQQLKVISQRVKSMGIKKNFPSLHT